MTSPLHREIHNASVSVIKYIAENGWKNQVERDELMAMVPVELHPALKKALYSPGMTVKRLVEKLDESGEDSTLLAEETELPTAKQLDGVLSDLHNLHHRKVTHQSLCTCLEDLESGDPIREEMAHERLKKVFPPSASAENVESLSIPSGPVNTIVGLDRSGFPKTYTVFDTWCVLGPGELGVILAGPSVGKTTGLVDIGAGYVTHNKGVVIHFSEEIRMSNVAMKYIRHITNDHTVKPSNVEKAYKRIRKLIKGDIVIESHSTGTSTVPYLTSRVERILDEIKYDKPLAIIVDYAALLYSAKESRYDAISQVIIGLRKMACDFDCPIWTASQPQRAPARDIRQPPVQLDRMIDALPVLGLSDVAECWAIPQVADVVLSLNQTREEREQKIPQARLHNAKTREPLENAPVNLTIPLKCDYGTCTFI